MRKEPWRSNELFDHIIETLRKQNLLPDNLDYILSDKYECVILNTCQFEFTSKLDFGGSEGIYLDLGVRYKEEGQTRTCHIGTAKTLETSREAMEYMGKLFGDFIFEADNYVNANLDDFEWSGYKVTAFKENGERYGCRFSFKELEKALEKKDELLNDTKIARVEILDLKEREITDYQKEGVVTVSEGSVEIKNPFTIREFDEDDGWKERTIKTGTYEYRVRNFRGWKPRQLFIDGEWVDVAGDCAELEQLLTGDEPVKNEEYTPSATMGDYSPSCPWNAPGMSVKDFI